MSNTWPDNITDEDIDALNELAHAGVGEGDFDGDDHGVPAEALYAYECLEAAEAGFSPEEETE